MKFRTGCMILPVCAALAAGLPGRKADLAGQRGIIAGQESVLDSLKNSEARYMNDAEVLASRIRLFRKDEDLNAREHRTLQKLLRDSQNLEARLGRVTAALDSLEQVRDRTIQDMLREIDAELADQLSVLNAGGKGDSGSDVIPRFQELLQWKRELAARQEPVAPASRMGLKLEIRPEDTAQELRWKGDILLDREERFRNEVEMIDERIRSLRIESDVRRKVADMTRELDLFDEREELLNHVGIYASSSEANNSRYWDGTQADNSFLDAEGMTDSKTAIGGENTLPMAISENPAEPGRERFPRSPENIEASIGRLAAHQKTLKAHADSLKTESRRFYDEAEKRRNLNPR